MTAIQLRDKLDKLIAKGYGKLIVQIYGMEDNMPIADDIVSIERAEEYYGDRIWINESAPVTRHLPEWM